MIENLRKKVIIIMTPNDLDAGNSTGEEGGVIRLRPSSARSVKKGKGTPLPIKRIESRKKPKQDESEDDFLRLENR